MTTPPAHRAPPPESLGPGTETGAGTVSYGIPSPVQAVIDPPRSAEERERDRAERAKTARCPRCMELPDSVVEPIARALRAAREGRPL